MVIEGPYIVKYFGYIEKSKKKCLLLEYVEGETLREYNTKTLTNKQRYDMILEILHTVQYIHEKGLICRDLHANNIIINYNKDAILIDFDRIDRICSILSSFKAN